MADFGITEALTAIGSAVGLGGGTAAAGATAAGAAGAAAGGGIGGALATAAPYLAGAGTLLSAKAGLDNANYQAATQRAEATALQDKANEDAAAGEQQAIQQQRRSNLVLSRAQAYAAGSGTEATSPDVLTTEGRIAQQGQYNALSSLYQGQAQARSADYQSNIDLYNADRISAAAPLTAGGTILSGLSSFARNRAMLRAYTQQGQAPPFALFGAS